MESVEKIAEAVLYEGYILYPYRQSALKNQKRWTFGGVYPRAYSESSWGDDPWLMQSQVLVTGDEGTRLGVKVRFLQVADRKVGRYSGGVLEFVEELEVGGQVHRPWEEAIEREVASSPMLKELLAGQRRLGIGIPEGVEEEPLTEASGETVGAIVRGWRSLQGTVEVGAERLQEGIFRLTVRITNSAPWDRGDRESTLKHTLVSTHTIMRADGGEFVSLLEPPEEYQEAVRKCENIKTWPVLVGEEGQRDTMLSSPIILYDYPQVAPESPGNLFDGGEMDELLTLSIMTMSDEEKEEMRKTDPRSREILERTEDLSAEELMKLHGTMRSFRSLREEG